MYRNNEISTQDFFSILDPLNCFEHLIFSSILTITEVVFNGGNFYNYTSGISQYDKARMFTVPDRCPPPPPPDNTPKDYVVSIETPTSRATVTSAHIPEKTQACYRARNLCAFSGMRWRINAGLMHRWCISFGVSDVTVVLGMRQTIVSWSILPAQPFGLPVHCAQPSSFPIRFAQPSIRNKIFQLIS